MRYTIVSLLCSAAAPHCGPFCCTSVRPARGGRRGVKLAAGSAKASPSERLRRAAGGPREGRAQPWGPRWARAAWVARGVTGRDWDLGGTDALVDGVAGSPPSQGEGRRRPARGRRGGAVSREGSARFEWAEITMHALTLRARCAVRRFHGASLWAGWRLAQLLEAVQPWQPWRHCGPAPSASPSSRCRLADVHVPTHVYAVRGCQAALPAPALP